MKFGSKTFCLRWCIQDQLKIKMPNSRLAVLPSDVLSWTPVLNMSNGPLMLCWTPVLNIRAKALRRCVLNARLEHEQRDFVNSRCEQQSLGKILDRSGNYIFAIERMPEAKKVWSPHCCSPSICVRHELVCSRHRHTPRYMRPYILTQMENETWVMHCRVERSRQVLNGNKLVLTRHTSAI